MRLNYFCIMSVIIMYDATLCLCCLENRIWWCIISVLLFCLLFVMLKYMCLVFLINTCDITICLWRAYYIHIWHKLCLYRPSDDHIQHCTVCPLPDNVRHHTTFASFPWRPGWCYTISGPLLDDHVRSHAMSHHVSASEWSYRLCLHIS